MALTDIIKTKADEKILFVLHRHSFTFLSVVLLFLILFIIPIALYFMITSIFPHVLDSTNTYTITILAVSVYYLSTYVFFYAAFIDFYLDMWVITDDRIIDVEQHSLFHREITELELFRIQDVTTQVQGVLPTLLNYGKVTVKTASNNMGVVFHDVPNPNHIRNQLIQLAEQDRKKHGISD